MSVKLKNGEPTSPQTPWVDPDDAPELTDEHFERADLYHGETLIRRGRPPTGQAKTLVSLRLDPQLVKKLRASGPGWQTRAAEALRQWADKTG